MIQVLRPNFEKGNGLVVVIVQDTFGLNVVMQAYTNEEAFRLTLQTGYAHFFSRSRNCLWKKGEESGNDLSVKAVFIDCDGDSLVYVVEMFRRVACHTGQFTCFYRNLLEVDQAEFPSKEEALQIFACEVEEGLITRRDK